MDVAPLATLAGLLLLKEMGVPIPVPGDLLVLGAGAATSGRPEAAVWLVAILAAGYAGGTIQFLLIRGAMRGPLLALLARIGMPEARLEGLAARFRSGGPRAVAVARTTPGLRMAAIAASGVAALPLRTFLPGLVAGNTVFVAGHFGLGFVIGKPALGVASELGNPAVVAAILVALSAVGAVAWVAIRRRSADAGFVAAPVLAAAGAGPVAAHATGHQRHGQGEVDLATWADAACPICFSLAATRMLRADPAPR